MTRTLKTTSIAGLTVEELASLVDSTQGPPTLPNGHPFNDVQSNFYWSATTIAGVASSARIVRFLNGEVFTGGKANFNNFV